jgi:hypothetical protein
VRRAPRRAATACRRAAGATGPGRCIPRFSTTSTSRKPRSNKTGFVLALPASMKFRFMNAPATAPKKALPVVVDHELDEVALPVIGDDRLSRRGRYRGEALPERDDALPSMTFVVAPVSMSLLLRRTPRLGEEPLSDHGIPEPAEFRSDLRGAAGQPHSVISGASSPCSRVYARHARRFSSMS